MLHNLKNLSYSGWIYRRPHAQSLWIQLESLDITGFYAEFEEGILNNPFLVAGWPEYVNKNYAIWCSWLVNIASFDYML